MDATRRDRSFQSLILGLQAYWAERGCVILQPYDMEVGAGTFHPATTLRSLGPEPWRAAYVQPSRRPGDGRYGENPNRLQHYYQFQVILKPAPEDVQDQYLGSLDTLGIDVHAHDIRFVEDDWESPTLGAWGLGWEVWCDGMEVTQFTYFQQVGGIDCDPVPVELTYGMERLAMYVQGVDNVYDLDWDGHGTRYGDVFLQGRARVLGLQFRARRCRAPAKPLQRCGSRVHRPARDRPAPVVAGLRPMHEGQSPLQPARRAGRDQRGRARGLHRPRPRTRQGLLRSLAGGGSEVTCSRSFHAHARRPNHVMAGLVPAIHVFVQPPTYQVEGDARNESGHDDDSGRAAAVAHSSKSVAKFMNRTLVSTSHA